MQTYEEYKHGVHTPGQASERVKYCCTDFSYRFGLRVLLTFQGAMLFIIALQANTLISGAIDEPIDGGVKEFDMTRFGIIMLFTTIVIILSYVKEYYVRRHGGVVETFGNGKYESPVETTTHWAHGNYQL